MDRQTKLALVGLTRAMTDVIESVVTTTSLMGDARNQAKLDRLTGAINSALVHLRSVADAIEEAKQNESS
jgi:hypothetical protein